MDPERWQVVKAVLDEAARRPPGERKSYLKRACGDDGGLRREVESLLVFDDETRLADDQDACVAGGTLLDRPLFDVNSEDVAAGRRIGHYRIVRPLGRGGMGAVYLATREDDYSQQVALKLIQRGLGTRDLVARFHEERQILADLEHPQVARLLDGGTTEDGLPYLIMERVEGEPVDGYCDRRRLGVRERLELFRQVLSAVHFSHQHLVVHRDLKPGNILVTGDGLPKLIDFGIAKLLQHSGGEEPAAAPKRQRLLSPRYASPEQVRGRRVTTASDVYSLGVLLYKLLAGDHPYPFQAATEEELVRAICEAEPAPPSVAATRDRRAAEIARARATSPAKLRRALADDLDAIVMKAMAKRPEKRYGSVERFSEDLGRSLAGLPVRARAGSLAYRGRKFVRRHRLALAAAVLALAVAAFFLATFVRLVQERARVEATVDFVEVLFRESNPDRADGEELSAREILERASARAGPDLRRHPMIQAEVDAVLGRVYQNLGDLAEAQRLLAEALRLQRQHGTGDRTALARRINELSAVLHEMGELEAAEPLYREALELAGGCSAPDPAAVRIASNLAVLRTERGEFAEAERLERCVRDRRRRLLPADHPDQATSLVAEAFRRYNQGELEESERLLQRALVIRRDYYGPMHTRVAKTLNNLGRVLLAGGRAEEAETVLRQALDLRRQLLDDDHLDVAATEKNLAQALTELGRGSEAEALARHAVASLRSVLPPGHWRVADAESVLGGCLAALGRVGEGEALLTLGYRILQREKGESFPDTRAARRRLTAYERLSREPVRDGKPTTRGSPGESPGEPEPKTRPR